MLLLKWGDPGPPGKSKNPPGAPHHSDGTLQQPGFQRGTVDSVTAAAAATAAVATTTATAVTAAAAIAPTATTATTAAAGLSLVDADHAAHPLDILEFVDGLGFLSITGQLNKGKTAFATRVPIEGQAALLQLPILGKQALEIFHFGIEGKITHVNCHERKTI
jgi:hypothetical protein